MRAPQTSVDDGQAARVVPCGAPVTALHLPTAPGTSHASQLPVQVESQQTPSVQKPLPHWLPLVQVPPLGATHTPGVGLELSAHSWPAAQLSTVQQTLVPVVGFAAQ